MKSLGLFGINIPTKYGGLDLDERASSHIKLELSSGWLSLSALLSSHLRTSYYIAKYGSEEQKEKYLNKLAKGEIIAAHPNNEKNAKKMELMETRLGKNKEGAMTLSGTKDWVTNGKES